MNIAFVNRMVGISRGGGEIWDLKMAEGLEDRGAKVTFYVGKPLRSDLPEPIESFETVPIPTPHLQDLAYAAPQGIGGVLADVDAHVFSRRVARQLARDGVDLVQVCSRPPFARYVEAIPAPVTLVMHGKPYSLWYDMINPWTSSYDLLTKFDQVIATGATSNLIREQSDIEVLTVNPGVDTALFSPDSVKDDGSDTFTILSVGRFVPIKNYSLLIDVFSEIVEVHPGSELVLVGDGPLGNKLKSQVRNLDIEDSVRFPGYIPHQDLPRYYNEADLLVLSSKHESFGMTLLEAMSCGTPVVAPRTGEIPKIVNHGENGLLFDIESKKALAGAITQCMSNPDILDEYSQAARDKVVDKFDWAHGHKQLFNLYSGLIDQDGKHDK